MYIKGFVKISKKNIKNFICKKDGTALLHTTAVLPNGKNECWVLDANAEIIDDGEYIVVKLAEVNPCRK